MKDMKVKFKHWNCIADFSRYATGNRVAIRLLEMETGDHIAIATVNLPDSDIRIDEIAVKDYSENEGMVQALVEAEIIEPLPLMKIQSGWVEIPIHRLTKEALNNIRI